MNRSSLSSLPWFSGFRSCFAIAIAVLLCVPVTKAATITFDGGADGTGTALDTAANWVGNALPTTTAEVLLDNSVITLPTQLTTTGASLTWGNLIWNNNATSAITIDSAGATNRSITLSGGGGSAEAILQGGAAGDLILLGSNATTNTLTIGGNAGVGTARLNMALGASGNFNVVGSGATLNISSSVSGAFNLNKTGAGTLTLSGANSFGGATNNFTLTAGTLNINAASALGNSGNTFIINGGTFDNTSGAAITTSNYKQTWNSDFVFTGSNNLSMGTGTISLGTAAGTSRTVAVNGGTLTLGGIISSGTTANSLIKDGAGTLALNGVNTFAGGITVKNGTLIGGAAASLGPGTAILGDSAGSVSASLLFSTASTVSTPIAVASGSSGNTLTIGSVSGGGSVTLSGTVSLGHDLTLTNANPNLMTLSGVISETGGARAISINAGSGTVALSGNNTFSGGVTLNSGRLQTAALNSTGTGPLTIMGGIIDNTTTSATLSLLNNSSYAWNGDFAFSGSYHVTLGTGAVTMSGNRIVTTNVITASTLTVSGPIGDGGNGYSLTKAGIGTLTLNGANTYSGATLMIRGILNLTGAASALVNTSGVTVTGGTLNLGVTSGAGVANRINPNTTLTLGGSGVFNLNAGATGPVNSQSFNALSVVAGSSQLSTTSATNAGTFTFGGSADSVYTRALGGTVRIVVGSNTSFTNAPTGGSVIGSGSNAILIGAVTGPTATATATTDFVRSAAGAISAPTYGTNLWESGVNTNITAPFSASGNTQSLRFNTNGDLTLTLTGTSTIESGGILVSTNAFSGGVITGGTLQAASGKDLWIYSSMTATTPQGLKVASLIADNGNSSLTKSGPGTVFLTNAGNTYAGGTVLGEGILNVNGGGALGTGGLIFAGSSTLQAGAAVVDLGNRGITISAGQIATFHSNGSANTITASGVISGSGGLTKTGFGTLTLSGANTYTGVTTIDNGTLKLDFSAPGAPVSNIISSSSLLSPGGASFIVNGAFAQSIVIQGKDGTANSQTFGGSYTNVLGNAETVGVYFNRGMTRMNFAAGSGGTLTVNMGAVSRGYSTDVNANADITIGPGVTVLTSLATSTTPIGNWITVNGNTWAQASGGNIVPFSAYSSSYSTANVSLDAGTGGTLTASPSSLRFNNNSAATVTPGAGAVRQLVTGGLLVTPNVGANTSTIAGGALAGYGARDLMIHQNNIAGDLHIDATIVDIAARTMSVSKSGAGKVILTANNTYTGQSYVNEGTLVVSGDAVASFTRTATSTATNPTLTMSDTSGIFIGQAVTGGGLTASSLTWTVVAINPGVSVTLSSNATTGVGGTYTFGGAGGLGAAATVHYIASAGTVQIGNGGATGSLATGQTISNNGAVILNRSNDFTFGNVISGTGSLEKQGAGNATLTGANTFTGDTKISGGSLILSTVATNLQTSTLDYNSYGGTISFGTLAAVTLGGLKGNQNLALTNTSAAAVTLSLGSNHQDATYSGALSGAGSVSKIGGGAQTLSGTNINTGTIAIGQGTLNLTGSFTNTSTISISGGTLNLAGTFMDTGTLAVGAGVANLSGTYTRTAYNNGMGLTVTGGILNVTGTLGTSATIPTGQTAFSGNSVTNFSGTAYLSGTSATFRVAEITSATVNVTGGTLTIGTSSGGVVLGRNNATASGSLNVSGGSFVTAGNTAIRIGAGFTDAETSGASVLTISGAGNFNTGTTTGLFLLGSNLSGNTASTGTVNLDGGTLTTNRVITGGNIGASIFNFNGGTFKAAGTAATLATSISTANVRNGGAIIDTNGFNLTFGEALIHSTIAGDNALDGGLTKNGTGTLTLSGVNTYTGATIVNAGTLKAGSTAAFGSNSALTLADTAGANLDITGFNTAIGSLAGGGTTGGHVTLGSAALTVGGNNATTTYAGTISGAGTLSKVGNGTLILVGESTYSGGTTVSSGILLAGNVGDSASATGSGAISVLSGATLGGVGRIAPGVDKSITLTGGTLSVGNSTLATPADGILEIATSGTGTLSLDTASAFALDLISRSNIGGVFGTSDLARISGRMTIADGASLDIGNPTGISDFAAGDQWKLFDWSGLVTPVDGTFTDVNLPALSGMYWDLSLLYSDGIISITMIPEPSRALLLFFGAIFGLLHRRRR